MREWKNLVIIFVTTTIMNSCGNIGNSSLTSCGASGYCEQEALSDSSVRIAAPGCDWFTYTNYGQLTIDAYASLELSAVSDNFQDGNYNSTGIAYEIYSASGIGDPSGYLSETGWLDYFANQRIPVRSTAFENREAFEAVQSFSGGSVSYLFVAKGAIIWTRIGYCYEDPSDYSDTKWVSGTCADIACTFTVSADY